MTDLDKRKRLLIAESEAYRELLRFQVRNLQVASIRAKQRIVSFKGYLPLLMMGLPMVGSLFGRRRRSGLLNVLNVKRFGPVGFLAWQLLRKFWPLIKSLKRKSNSEPTAAEEYLSKRI